MTIATKEQELEAIIDELASLNAKRRDYMAALERCMRRPAKGPTLPEVTEEPLHE